MSPTKFRDLEPVFNEACEVIGELTVLLKEIEKEYPYLFQSDRPIDNLPTGDRLKKAKDLIRFYNSLKENL